MSEHIVVNDKTYLPSGELAKAFSYTIDYVSKLAREGKVDATRIGRQWFINPDSLKSFVDESEQKKAEQRAQLSEMRRREFQESQKELQPEVVTSANNSLVPASSAQVSVASPYHHGAESPKQIVAAVMGTSLVLFAGLLFGVVLTPERFAFISEDVFFTAKDQEAGAMSSYFETEVEAPSVSEGVTSGNAHIQNEGRGVVILEPTATEEQVQEVKQMFSDEVEVNFSDENSGVITPVFKESTDDSYRFIMVPVKDSS